MFHQRSIAKDEYVNVCRYLRRFLRHFAHPAERQDVAVALGVVVLLKVQMHDCDAIGGPSIHAASSELSHSPEPRIPRSSSAVHSRARRSHPPPAAADLSIRDR